MSTLSQIQLQKSVKDSAEDLQKTLKDLYQWEKDTKAKEQIANKEQRNETSKVPPVRSQIDSESVKIQNESKQEKIEQDGKGHMDDQKPLDQIKIEAGHFKEAGNNKVKQGQYEEAIALYSEAIYRYNQDAVYYSNRAFCYLKLERYEECINDCDAAINIDPKMVKAHYRRMQANESLGLAHKALEDCSKVLEIDPKNADGKKSFNRINQRIKRYDKNKITSEVDKEYILKPTFTQITDSCKPISVISKPAHLRSKKPIKRIIIDEVIEAKPNCETNNIQISDEIIEKLFNSSDCGSFVEVKKPPNNADTISNEIQCKTSKNNQPKAVQEKPNRDKIIDNNAYNNLLTVSNKILPEKPTSTAQFYANWKELSREQKYLYLKSIETDNVNKILGAGLDSETFSEIIHILEEFYIRDKIPLGELILHIGKHDEMSILNLFLSKEDRTAISNILTYIKETEQTFRQLDTVRTDFNII